MDTATRIGWFIMGAAMGFGYATGAKAVARGDYRAATGVTFVQPSTFGIGLQAQVQFIACPKDSVTPPGGPCENLILALLGNSPPDDIVREATLFAERLGYSDNDVNLMRTLSAALESGAQNPGTPAP